MVGMHVTGMGNQRLAVGSQFPTMQHAERMHPDAPHAPRQMLGTIGGNGTANTGYDIGLVMTQKVGGGGLTIGLKMHVAKMKVLQCSAHIAHHSTVQCCFPTIAWNHSWVSLFFMSNTHMFFNEY
jgi:hypothetical protein